MTLGEWILMGLLVMLLVELSLMAFWAYRVQHRADGAWEHMGATLERIAELNAQQTAIQATAFARPVPEMTQRAVTNFLTHCRLFERVEIRAHLLDFIDGPVLLWIEHSDLATIHLRNIVQGVAQGGEVVFRRLVTNASDLLNATTEGDEFRRLCRAHGYDVEKH